MAAKKIRTLTLPEQLSYPSLRKIITDRLREGDMTATMRRQAAEKYAENRGIKMASARRTIDRYATQASEKRGVKRPNPAVVQAFVESYREENERNWPGYEEIIEAPHGKWKEFSESYTYGDRDKAIEEARRMAKERKRTPSGESDPRPWKISVIPKALYARTRAILPDGEEVNVNLPDRRSPYLLILTYWVEHY